ncbi:MAG: 30S ribosomal protein S4 [Candidatus Altiarchaeota archaeon]
MGDPRKQRRKYSAPTHPWKAERIISENELSKKYGLSNKREVWRAKSTIARFRQQARLLLGSAKEESKKEAEKLIKKLNRMGVTTSNSLEDILTLTVEDLLERRLQTLVFKKGLANTPKQARQLIVHKKVVVGDNIVNVPSYKVSKDEEESVRLVEGFVIASAKKKQAEKPDATGTGIKVEAEKPKEVKQAGEEAVKEEAKRGNEEGEDRKD